MKEQYQTPEMEIISFDYEKIALDGDGDIFIRPSGPGGDAEIGWGDF